MRKRGGKRDGYPPLRLLELVSICLLCLCGCTSLRAHREKADRSAYRIIKQKQKEALGYTESLRIDSPAETLRRRLLLAQGLPRTGSVSLGIYDIPPNRYWDIRKHLPCPGKGNSLQADLKPLRLSLLSALQVAARNSREYQTAKEKVYLSALDLDLERDAFRDFWGGEISGKLGVNRTSGKTVVGSENTANLSLSRTLKSGVSITTEIALDLVKLLTAERESSLGVLGDATITVPLLRGGGRPVVTERMKQAERNVLYAIYDFERYKKVLATQVATEYLRVLLYKRWSENAERNYRLLQQSSQRARALADAGRIPEFQYDQAVQAELRAQDRWIQARRAYSTRLDQFKLLLGLPPDAEVELEEGELDRVSERVERLLGKKTARGPLELEEQESVELALKNRLDLRVAEGKVLDAQRSVFVAVNELKPGLTLVASGEVGERRALSAASLPDASFNLLKGLYSLSLTGELPLERTSERNEYRKSIIALQKSVRSFQQVEDNIKLEVREALRELLKAKERVETQLQALRLAEKRVRSTGLFFQAGRAEVRDLIEAQEALLRAQDALTSAAVDYRVAELELQRDLGVLRVSADGIWQEYASGGNP